MGNDTDPVRKASKLDSVGFTQNVVGPIHLFNHILHSVLSCSISVEHMELPPLFEIQVNTVTSLVLEHYFNRLISPSTAHAYKVLHTLHTLD